MAGRKQKNARPAASAAARVSDSSRLARRRVLRSVAVFVIVMGGFYAVVHNPARPLRVFEGYHHAIAVVSGGVLTVFGYDVTIEGAQISTASPRFSVGIVQGCDAIEPLAAFLAAVIATPVGLVPKAVGATVGAAALLTVNLFRIISLILIGMYAPKALDVMHEDVWQALFIVLAIAAWAFWVRWATKGGSERLPPDPVEAVGE